MMILIQSGGFIVGVGLGGYVYQNDELAITGTAKLDYIITHSINGNLTSVGVTSVVDGAFHLEAGVGITHNTCFLN